MKGRKDWHGTVNVGFQGFHEGRGAGKKRTRGSRKEFLFLKKLTEKIVTRRELFIAPSLHDNNLTNITYSEVDGQTSQYIVTYP
jgi:hypothetical protein